MAKFKKIEVNGVYQFEAVNAAARKLVAKFGLGQIDIRGLLLLTSETKGKIELV